MQYYSFTVKNTYQNLKPTIGDYTAWLENAQTKGFNIQTYMLEFDKSNRLHIHGVAIGSPNLYKKRLMYSNFHQKIDQIDSHNDLIRWHEYITKDFYKRYEIEQTAVIQEIQQVYSFQ